MDLLSRCRDLAVPFYRDLLRSAQESLRVRLFEQAEKSASNDDQRCFYEAIQILNRSGNEMLAIFGDQLTQGYQQFLSGREAEPEALPARLDGLQLLEREQLEDELAVSMIVSRATAQHAEALWKLNRRMAALRGGKPVNDVNNPFGPARVCEALRGGMVAIDCDLKARIFIYKHLGKLLLAAFGKIFANLNETLTQGGVLPNLRFSVDKNAVDKDTGDAQAPITPAPPVAPPPSAGQQGVLDQHQLYIDILGALRNRQFHGGRQQSVTGVSYRGLETGHDGAPANFLPMDYALVLSALQQAPEFSSTTAMNQPLRIDAIEAQLFGQLKAQARPDARHQLASKDADTVDLVGMIFRFMLDDGKIPDLVKSLLSHLHTPYLKLALLDPRFLEDQQHPARVLLNQMAETGTRWVGDEKDRVALPKLKTVVDTILRGFIDDASLFDRLLDDFSRFREGLEKRAEMVERRNREAQEGIERLSGAKQRAMQEIAARSKGFSVPLPIQQLLEKPWADFLAFNYLRNGEQSLSWKAALKVVDGVLWSVQSGSSRSRDEFQRHQQQLEQSIAEGLRTIGYDSEAGQDLLRALLEAQEMAFKGEPIASPPPPAPVVAAEPAPETQLAAQFSPEERAIAEQLRSRTEFGTWFEFDRPGQKPLLVKLAWFSRASGHFMFVTSAGIKHSIETLPDLVRGMSAGRIRTAHPEKRTFMERAFSAILGSLRLRD
jgi:hypothetical protein